MVHPWKFPCEPAVAAASGTCIEMVRVTTPQEGAMRRHLALATAATIVAFAGCENIQSGGPTGLRPTGLRPSADLLQLTGPNGPGGFVTTGGADIVFTPSDISQRISYNAKTQSDGTVQGQFQVTTQYPTGVLLTFHGYVECYDIDDINNRARVIGFVEKSSNTALVPENVYIQWSSEDNGEGSGAIDRQSDTRTVGIVSGCPAVTPFTDVLLMPIESGNVQIHPAQSSK
jgi:hypothetical protein